MGSLSWLMVAAYILVSLIAASQAFRHWSGQQGMEKRRPDRFWLTLALYLIFLALTRHLHLHESVYNYVRELALQRGWYEMRRPFQSAALVLIFIGAGSLTSYWVYIQNQFQGIRILNFVGAGILTSIWILRTISFHYTDSLIHLDLGLISVGSIIELIGLFAILLAAFKPLPLHK